MNWRKLFLIGLLVSAPTQAYAACSATYPVADPNDGMISFLAGGTNKPAFAPTTFQSVEAGTLTYDSTANALKLCDGTAWTAIATGSAAVSADSLDFADFKDAMALDASTDIATGANTLSITNDGAGTTLRVNDNGNGDTTPFTIDASGNVGIATSVINAQLSLGGHVANTKIALYDDNIYRYGFGIQANDLRIHTSGTTDDFTFRPGAAASPIVIFKGNGNVGIGTTAPDRLLHPEIDDVTANAASKVFRITHTTSGTPANGIGVGLEFEVETSANNNEIGVAIDAVAADTTAASEDFDLVFRMMAGGAAAVEKIRLASDGTITATAYNSPSDRRLKADITDTGKGLSDLMKIGVKDFSFIADPDHKRVQGYIAQDLVEVYPEAVVVGSEVDIAKPWSVDYGRLTPLLVRSVQELKADNDSLEAIVAKQAEDIKELRDEFRAYKAAHP